MILAAAGKGSETGGKKKWFHRDSYYQQLHERERRTLELEARPSQANLQLLKTQLQPHFLFNTLNNLFSMAQRDQNESLAGAISRLSGLMRYMIYDSSAERLPLVTLREEMETVSEYLRLESLRYEQRLQVETAIDGGSLDRRVPPLLVQTLVENAIKHGIARSPQGGVLRIEAACQGGELRLANLNEDLRTLFELTKLDTLFHIAGSRDEALSSF